MQSSFAREVCVCVTTYALHVANTAPSMVSKDDALFGEDDLLERYMAFVRRHLMWAYKGFFWVTGAAELLIIAATKQRALALPKSVLPLVWPSGKTFDSLRLGPVSIAGMALVIGGTLLRTYCYRMLKNMFTFDMGIRKDHKLIKDGPYGVVRHPAYLGMILVCVGGVMWYGAPGSWLKESGVLDTLAGKLIYVQAVNFFIVTWCMVSRTKVENENLKRAFGKEWEEWAQKVPYSLFPGIY